jgi:hypothetical protein
MSTYKNYTRTNFGVCTTNSTTVHMQKFTETMKDVMKIISARNQFPWLVRRSGVEIMRILATGM